MSAPNILKLKIDGVEVTVPEGTTILKAAKANGIIIPTLCQVEGLTPYGGCRLCLVEISGSPKLFPACTTPVGPNMEITTKSNRLTRLPQNGRAVASLGENAHLFSLRSQRPL